MTAETTPDTSRLTPTLGRDDYCSPQIYALERQRIFHRGWMYAGHDSSVPAGARRVVDIAGESVIVTRTRDGVLHAFANVCRHRGSALCSAAPSGSSHDQLDTGSIQCPYHAWTYSLDGRLLSTPRVDRDEIDRDEYGLWHYRVDVWNGLIFVSLAADGPSLDDWLAEHGDGLDQFVDIPFAELSLVERTTAEVAANWKILIENYEECLHCPVVHPELVERIPLYQTGAVLDPDRDDGGVELAGRAIGLSLAPEDDLPRLPGISEQDAHLYRGAAVFPNLLVDVVGNGVVLTTLLPHGPDRTTVIAEYLFAPGVTAESGHDVRSTIDFNELVAAQDNAVCEAVQRGVASVAFTQGVLTAKDSLVADFDVHYVRARGAVDL
jgi:Rieske 2Fe-2S family protein